MTNSREAKARKNNFRAPERVKATTMLKWLNIAPSSLTGRWSPSVRVEGFCRGHQVHWPKTGNISEIQFLDIRWTFVFSKMLSPDIMLMFISLKDNYFTNFTNSRWPPKKLLFYQICSVVAKNMLLVSKPTFMKSLISLKS